MTHKFFHPFDPSLQMEFSETAYQAAGPYRQDSRALFYTLMHISEHDAAYPVVYDFIKHKLAATRSHSQSRLSRFVSPDSINELLTPLPPYSDSFSLTEDNLRNCLTQLCPMILTEPCWLQSISQAATCQDPIAIELMAIYLELIRDNQCRDLYLSLLLKSGLNRPVISSWEFVKQEAVSECVFDFSALQLALACFPRVFFPEILGFTVSFCRSQTILACFRPMENDQGLSHFLKTRRNRQESVIPLLIKIIADYLSEFPDQADELWQRIQWGFYLHHEHSKHCDQHLLGLVQNPNPAYQTLSKLLQRKAPAAFGHHSRIKLGGRPMDDWFGDTSFDSAGFLSALKDSPYIDTLHPEQSHLLKLFDFKGPMFGVLNSAERAIFENWLIDENAEIQHNHSESERDNHSKSAIEKRTFPKIQYAHLKNRDLFYYLVNADLYPEVLATARNRVDGVLKWARLFNRLPFRHYRHPAFEYFIDTSYQREVNAYVPIVKTPKIPKDAYLWGIEQFAPTILVDGCWLQHINQINYYSNHAIGSLLFKIYEDEIGNGKIEQNHPYIYSKLLNSIAVSLPPIDSKEFVAHSGFVDSAFDLPVYLLSISKFPSSFFPELLGLNMAIELSGLGNVYLRLSEELKFWGLDSAIIDVHISIDNVGSGHALLAKKAIQMYLDDIAAGFGDKAVEEHWRRIYTGYCSLQSVNTRFKFALLFRYFLKRLRS